MLAYAHQSVKTAAAAALERGNILCFIKYGHNIGVLAAPRKCRKRLSPLETAHVPISSHLGRRDPRWTSVRKSSPHFRSARPGPGEQQTPVRKEESDGLLQGTSMG